MRTRQIRTRTTAVAASLLVVLGLAACSGDDSSTDGATGSAATEAPADETSEAPADATTDEPADEQSGDTSAAGGADFCDATRSIADMSGTMSDIDPTDVQATVDQLDELTSALESVDEPPAKIADDWSTLTASFRSLTDGLAKAAEDPTDADAMSDANDAMSALQDQDFQDAGKRVATYAGANC